MERWALLAAGAAMTWLASLRLWEREEVKRARRSQCCRCHGGRWGACRRDENQNRQNGLTSLAVRLPDFFE